MAKGVTIDEVHVTILVPADLPDDQAEAIRRALAGDFLARLGGVIRAAIRMVPELAAARVSLGR